MSATNDRKKGKRATSDLNDDLSPSPAKLSRMQTEEEAPDYSSQVKKKLQSSTRTGQACDRCKIRKIRCDGLPTGCSPCIQSGGKCESTDRITGRTVVRGHVEGIEQQNRDLLQRVNDLEQQLRQLGADIKPTRGYNIATPPTGGDSQLPQCTLSCPPTILGSNTSSHEETNIRTYPAFRTGNMGRNNGENHSGMSPGKSNLSAIKGTAISILGMEIDIADFVSLDMDEPNPSIFQPQLFNKSYQAFLQSTLNINTKPERVSLPPKPQAIMFAEWYFRVINSYVPLLHKPTFMVMLNRWYEDPNFEPKAYEAVMIHMVFAIMFFQYAARNWEDPAQQKELNETSNMHYHFSLSMFYELYRSHTAQDVQALVLICLHVRNFPKPGASWLLTQTALSLATELGLHRSSKEWIADPPLSPLDVEMRKRTFWSLLAIHVTLSGKLGRPMVFRAEDIDAEMPEDIEDELLSHNGLDTSRPGKCGHKIGLVALRLAPLFLELYSTLYAARRNPDKYISTVKTLEDKLRAWEESIPPEHELGQDEHEGRVFACYAQAWSHEFRIVLRHPSVALTDDADFNAESMRICVATSRQLLGVVRQLQKFKSLDTTWYSITVCVMAITTTLFAQWENRCETSVADISALKEEMNLWLEIMGDVGSFIGSGPRLRDAVKVVTDGTIGLLDRSIPIRPISKKGGVKREESQSMKSSQSPTQQISLDSTDTASQKFQPEPLVQTTQLPPTSTFPQPFKHSDPPSANPNSTLAHPPYTYGKQVPTASSTTSYPPTIPLTHQPTPYPTQTQYQNYAEPTPNPPTMTYNQQPSHPHSFPAFPAHNNDTTNSARFGADPWRRGDSHLPYTGSQAEAWQQYTNTLTNNIDVQGPYPASALMHMGNGESPNVIAGMMQQSINGNAVGMHGMTNGHGNLVGQVTSGVGTSWPLNLFEMPHDTRGA